MSLIDNEVISYKVASVKREYPIGHAQAGAGV
jgi:hypothetical protein